MPLRDFGEADVLGQKQTLEHVCKMSALPPKADIREHDCHVRFVPILLQKSAMTGPSGWRELLELAAALHSLNKGNGLTSL